ncbi:hypothetical protein ACFFX0_06085 [Citricoccus parietis]|uniref:Uncharacterized protein n=1 Tax=Citricoccus parietis TaxID=592307 RepID=A0ABV5FVU0_9MICC
MARLLFTGSSDYDGVVHRRRKGKSCTVPSAVMRTPVWWTPARWTTALPSVGAVNASPVGSVSPPWRPRP